jgi:hypothetical protein
MEKKIITSTEVNRLVVSILGCNIPQNLHYIYTIPHSSGKTNFNYHYNKINSLISFVENDNQGGKILSLISLTIKPKIKIYLHVFLDTNNYLNFSISGSDLKKYGDCLPRIFNQTLNKNEKPPKRNGVYYYPNFMKNEMVTIAFGLRILEIYLLGTKVVENKSIGILELDVPINIPLDIFVPTHNYTENPMKLNNNKYIFAEIVSIKTLHKFCSYISSFYKFNSIFKKVIIPYNNSLVNEFLLSDSSFGIMVSLNHIAIINKENNRLNIYIPSYLEALRGLFDIGKLCDIFQYNCNFIEIPLYNQNENESNKIIYSIALVLCLVCEGKLQEPIEDLYPLLASIYAKNC